MQDNTFYRQPQQRQDMEDLDVKIPASPLDPFERLWGKKRSGDRPIDLVYEVIGE